MRSTAIYTIDPLLGEVLTKHETRIPIYPKTHYVMSKPTIKRAIKTIKDELELHEELLVNEGKIVEAQRLHQRTMYDLEMIKEMGFCRGIENYSRHLTGKAPGEPPPTLLDYLPKDAMMVIDESHQTVPQLGAMYKGDQSQKGNAGRIRVPPAERERQPAAELSGVRSIGSGRRYMSRRRPGHMSCSERRAK